MTKPKKTFAHWLGILLGFVIVASLVAVTIMLTLWAVVGIWGAMM